MENSGDRTPHVPQGHDESSSFLPAVPSCASLPPPPPTQQQKTIKKLEQKQRKKRLKTKSFFRVPGFCTGQAVWSSKDGGRARSTYPNDSCCYWLNGERVRVAERPTAATDHALAVLNIDPVSCRPKRSPGPTANCYCCRVGETTRGSALWPILEPSERSACFHCGRTYTIMWWCNITAVKGFPASNLVLLWQDVFERMGRHTDEINQIHSPLHSGADNDSIDDSEPTYGLHAPTTFLDFRSELIIRSLGWHHPVRHSLTTGIVNWVVLWWRCSQLPSPLLGYLPRLSVAFGSWCCWCTFLPSFVGRLCCGAAAPFASTESWPYGTTSLLAGNGNFIRRRPNFLEKRLTLECPSWNRWLGSIPTYSITWKRSSPWLTHWLVPLVQFILVESIIGD